MSRLVYGTRPVTEALRAQSTDAQALFIAEGKRSDPTLQRLFARVGQKPTLRPKAELDQLTGGANHQGVVLVVGRFEYTPLETLLARALPEQPLLVLDQVQDPRNLGAMVRSALVLGAAGAILPARRAAGVTAAVVRTAAGATEHLPIARVTNLARALAALKEAGYWLVGAVGEGGQAPEQLDLRERIALIMGSEGRGLRHQTLMACDLRVSIPMVSPLSLNVAVAAGILLAEVCRQRRA